MKRYIIKILLFFGIIAVVDLVIGAAGDYMQTHSKGGDSKRTNDLVMIDNHDVIIMGSSRAHHHYDTPYLSDTLGLNVYNAGYDGNGVILAYGILELITERYQPKLVLFDVEPLFDIYTYKADNNNIRYIAGLKPYYRNKAIEAIIRNVSIEEWYKVQSGLVRYNSSLISLLLENNDKHRPEVNGYAPLTGIYSGKAVSVNYSKEIIDTLKLTYIERLIKLTQSKGITIAFVASPRYGAISSDCFNPIKKICKRNNIIFIDYFADNTFAHNREFFKEPVHMNAIGAREYSRLLVNTINRLIYEKKTL